MLWGYVKDEGQPLLVALFSMVHKQNEQISFLRLLGCWGMEKL